MKKTHIILIIVIVVAIGIIISLVSNSSTYADFTEAMKYPEKTFHIIGTLSPEKELNYDSTQYISRFEFYMLDKQGKEMKVVYPDVRPRDFEKSEQVVVIGKMSGDSVFSASSILLKCPSKYNDEQKPEKFSKTKFSTSED